VTIVLDPTIPLSVRGAEWIARLGDLDGRRVEPSRDLQSILSDAGRLHVLDRFRPRGLFGFHRYWNGVTEPSVASVVTQTIEKVFEGGILAARRMDLLELAMNGGLPLILLGVDEWHRLADGVRSQLGPNIGESLLRRCRILAEASAWNGVPAVRVGDAGLSSRRW
jgi:hypothetical protein